jgi:hypothetical protein
VNVLALETDLVAKVQALMQPLGLKAEAYPDRPETYPFTHPVGVVLVLYRGSTYGPPKATDVMTQGRDLDYELTVLVRNLRSHQGAYPVLDALRGGLAGWMAPGAIQGARLGRDGFQSRNEGGVWQYAVVLRIPGLSIPTDPAALADPTDASYGLLVQTDFTLETP